MPVPITSATTRIDRVRSLDAPRAAVRILRPVEPDPFVDFFGIRIPRSELVRAGILALA